MLGVKQQVRKLDSDENWLPKNKEKKRTRVLMRERERERVINEKEIIQSTPFIIIIFFVYIYIFKFVCETFNIHNIRLAIALIFLCSHCCFIQQSQ